MGAGAQIIWISPSGGRDRPDPLTRELYPAPFDSSSVDNMRRISDHSGVPGHIYPLALLCYDIMPPPAQVEKQIGERRMISYHGVGVSVAPEMSYNEIAGGIDNPEEKVIGLDVDISPSQPKRHNKIHVLQHSQGNILGVISIIGDNALGSAKQYSAISGLTCWGPLLPNHNHVHESCSFLSEVLVSSFFPKRIRLAVSEVGG
ncbi:hypothetical protein ACLOJK_033716 [Asimina triloba]